MGGAHGEGGTNAGSGRPDEEPLAPIVDRLRDEVDGLRQAMRSRAIIDQAKGMLMERYGCTPDEAFDRLARLSQHANVKLADIASALVESSLSPGAGAPPARVATGRVTPADVARSTQAQALRSWPKQGSGDGEFGTRVRVHARRTRTRSELLAARAPQDLVTALVRTGLSDRPPSAAVLVTVDVTGVVAVLGTHGIPAAVAARWRTFPLDLKLPVCVTLQTGRGQWLTASDTAGAAAAGDPVELGIGLPGGWGTAAVLPLLAGGGCHGALVLVWSPGADPDPMMRAEVERIAAGVAVALQKLPQAVPDRPPVDEVDPTMAVLDALLHPVVLCEPVLADDRSLADLRVVHANPASVDAAGRGPEQVTGRSVLELYPDAVRNGLFAACQQVLETGAQLDIAGLEWRLAVLGRNWRGTADVRVTRYRGGVLITWADSDAVDRDGHGASEATA
jgi:PAS domain-containing protein